MEIFAFALPMLGCGLMMVVCMALMGRGRQHGQAPASAEEVEVLRAEVDRLRAREDRAGGTP